MPRPRFDQRTNCICAGTGLLHAEERGGHRPYSCTTCQRPGLPIDYWGMPSHRQRLIAHGDTAAWVDEQMAPLVLRLWEHGIETLFSCQGGPAHVDDNVVRYEGLGDCFGGEHEGYLGFAPTGRLSCFIVTEMLGWNRFPHAYTAEETLPHQHPCGVRFVTLRFRSLAAIYQGDVGLGGPAPHLPSNQYLRWRAKHDRTAARP